MILAVRLGASFLFHTVRIISLSILNDTSGDFCWFISLNPTIANAITFNSVANSSVELAVGSGTNTISSSGLILASGYSSGNLNNANIALSTILNLGSSINGTRDVIAVSVAPIDAGGDSFLGTLGLLDIY
jgi:hypothetical protein